MYVKRFFKGATFTGCFMGNGKMEALRLIWYFRRAG